MKTLTLFLLIGSLQPFLVSSCGEGDIDYVYFHRIRLINDTKSTVCLNADTLTLCAAPNSSADSDFRFGDKFLWGSNCSVTVGDSVIGIPYETNYMGLRGFYTEEEYDTRKFTNTFRIDDEWVERLWRQEREAAVPN